MIRTYAVIAVLIGMLLGAVTAYYKGYSAGKAKVQGEFDDYKTRVIQAAEQARAVNEQRIREAEANTARVAELYAAWAADIDRVYVSRLRNAERRCSGMPAASAAASGADERPADDRPSAASYEATCERLEADCARTTLMVVGLQDWIERVCN